MGLVVQARGGGRGRGIGEVSVTCCFSVCLLPTDGIVSFMKKQSGPSSKG